MVKKNKRNTEFLVLALVSVVIIVAVFAAGIGGGTPSGYVTDVGGSTWTCVYDNGYKWEGTKGGEVLSINVGKYINYDTINCDDYYWTEASGCSVAKGQNNICDAAHEGDTCKCIKMEDIGSIPSGG